MERRRGERRRERGKGWERAWEGWERVEGMRKELAIQERRIQGSGHKSLGFRASED
jgi:hypothetical protein